MTDLETRAIVALRAVKMPEKGWHRRRATFLIELMARDPNSRLDQWQAGDLWFLVWRFRRQITDAEVVAHANEIVNGAMHLAF